MTPTIDQQAVARLRRFGGDKLLGDMIDLFAQHGPERLAAAQAAFSIRDAAVVKAALHALKSSAAQLGASVVYQLCSDGEGQAASGDLSRIEPVLVRLDEELPRALAALDDDWRQPT
jgi:HPt (histidine-containing phosphotransfer) domain-containing protein